LLAVGCGKSEETASKPVVIAPTKDDATAAKPLPQGEMFINTSIRCGECHGKMLSEWTDSAHSTGFSAPDYRVMAEAVGDRECGENCHAPLVKYVGDQSDAAREGVTCDVCHNLREVDASESRGVFELQVHDMTKYGPLCNADDHYFHRMGCSPLHESAELCSACHDFKYKTSAGSELWVLTTYRDWLAGPYAKKKQCQDCHMPGTRAMVAEGSPERDGVPDHSFLGTSGTLRQQALSSKISVRDEDGHLAIDVALTNKGSGHKIPSGIPARRFVIRAKTIDASGEAMGTAEASIGRVLVDAAGKTAPFTSATKEQSDTRIAPGQSRTIGLKVDAPRAGKVDIEVVWVAYAHEVATALGLADVEQHVLIAESVKFGEPRDKGGRPKLPKTVKTK
jgi:hypothetical protein